jgi:hypothetical protein
MSNQEITNGRCYRPSLVVTVALLAMVIGIVLKSNMRELRIASMTPVPAIAGENLRLTVEN